MLPFGLYKLSWENSFFFLPHTSLESEVEQRSITHAAVLGEQ
jgi:hypothetical protein